MKIKEQLLSYVNIRCPIKIRAIKLSHNKTTLLLLYIRQKIIHEYTILRYFARCRITGSDILSDIYIKEGILPLLKLTESQQENFGFARELTEVIRLVSFHIIHIIQ